MVKIASYCTINKLSGSLVSDMGGEAPIAAQAVEVSISYCVAVTMESSKREEVGVENIIEIDIL